MTYEQNAELLKWLIPLIFAQLTLLVVAAIHAWASANRGKENREQNREILKDVAEVKGKLAADKEKP